MPKFTPQSPEAAAFSKYGEYAVSLSTGVPDISIVLFEIESNKFKFPITLTYHASGIKVNEFAGWVGLGWSLNEGGRISRTVRGREDESYSMTVRDPASIDPSNDTDFLYLEQLETLNGSFDVEPDIYNYSFPGKSGRFLFLGPSEIMIPYCGVKVAGPNQRNKLLDESGNIYYYDYIDHPTSDFPNEMSSYDPVSSWLLTKMVDPGTTDSINFSYQSVGTGCLGLDYVDYIVVEDQVMNQMAYGHGDYVSGISTPKNYTIITSGLELVPSQISYSQGLIKFVPSLTNRQDRPDNYGATFKSLDKIEIYSIDNLISPKKTIKFYQSYFINGTAKRLRLDSIRILDKDLLLVQRYKFSYNESSKLPEYASKQKDLWGYFNGKPNTMLLPRMTIPFINDDGTQTYRTIGTGLIDGRDPDPMYMQAYILNRITYPTGGYTLFEFETNKYLDAVGTPKYAGGLRIAKIKSYNEDGSFLTKTYKYGENESGYGNFNSFLSDLYFSTPPLSVQCTNCKGDCTTCISKKRSRTFTSTPNTDLIPYDGSPVVYSMVTEYSGDENSNSGKIVYHFNYEQDERVFSMGVDNCTRISKFFKRGLLISKTVYANLNGIYKKTSCTINNYFNFPTQNPFCSIRAIRLKLLEGWILPEDKVTVFRWSKTNPVFYGDNLLTSTYEYTYDINDESKYVVKKTTYNYNSPVYTQISTSIEIDSRLNTTLVKTYKYPTDFTGTTVYDNMTSKNMISHIIQEDQLLNGITPLICKRTNYDLFNNRFYAPSSIEYKKGSNPWETRIRFYSYNLRGKVLSLSKEGDIKTNYLWGYNDGYPVAEVIGSDYNTIYNLLTTTEKATLNQYSSDSQVRTIIQKIRTNFQNSNVMVSTYTHKPLIGMTSLTDPNGKITYYEYDSFGRLKNMKDQDLVILKEFNYHYKE